MQSISTICLLPTRASIKTLGLDSFDESESSAYCLAFSLMLHSIRKGHLHLAWMLHLSRMSSSKNEFW